MGMETTEALDGWAQRKAASYLAQLSDMDLLRAAAEAERDEARRKLAFFTDGGQTITVGRTFLSDLEAEVELLRGLLTEYERWSDKDVIPSRKSPFRKDVRAALADAGKDTP